MSRKIEMPPGAYVVMGFKCGTRDGVVVLPKNMTREERDEAAAELFELYGLVRDLPVPEEKQ